MSTRGPLGSGFGANSGGTGCVTDWGKPPPGPGWTDVRTAEYLLCGNFIVMILSCEEVLKYL